MKCFHKLVSYDVYRDYIFKRYDSVIFTFRFEYHYIREL